MHEGNVPRPTEFMCFLSIALSAWREADPTVTAATRHTGRTVSRKTMSGTMPYRAHMASTDVLERGVPRDEEFAG